MRKLALSLFALSCMALLPGCAALVVGGAAAGGYYVGKDKRSVSQIADDASITSAVNAKFLGDNDIRTLDIDVDTYEGVVTLTGTVTSETAHQHAVELAKQVKGVKRVIDKLTVQS